MSKKIVALLLIMTMPGISLADDYVSPGQFIGYRTLVAFWSSDCAGCTQQLPALINLAKFHPAEHVAIVSLKGDGTDSIPHALPTNVLLYSVDDAATSLRSFGANANMLPFSAVVDKNGSVCISHAGIQGLTTFEDWIKKC